jgi:protein-disulfide isomerase
MFSVRAAGALALIALFSSKLTTCRSPGETGSSEAAPARSEAKDVNLPGIDTASLTGREKGEWSRYVSELLAPCPDQPVSVAQCVQENRACKACAPAAKFLVKQVQRGRARSQVETAFKARFAPDQVKNISIDDSPVKGAPGAPITIAEWADFECPGCAAASPKLDEIVARYPGQVRLVFKHFPLSIHQHAEKAARAAVVAHKQGKFWEMHHALFQNQKNLDEANVERLAKSIGLDMTRFAEQRDSEAVADVVVRDRKQGEALQLSGTPAIFINARQFASSPDFADELDEWIELELEILGLPKAGAKPAATPSSAPSAAEPKPTSEKAAAEKKEPVTPKKEPSKPAPKPSN